MLLLLYLTRRIIYEKLSTQNFASDFNSRRPFAQILLSQNSKGKYESRKILVFVRKMRKKNDFLEDFLISLVVSSTF
jgi:hypothetical protein